MITTLVTLHCVISRGGRGGGGGACDAEQNLCGRRRSAVAFFDMLSSHFEITRLSAAFKNGSPLTDTMCIN
jgi:hypothetical protein